MKRLRNLLTSLAGPVSLAALLASLLGGAIFVSPAYAASFTVNSTADTVDVSPGNGVCADAFNNCTLRAAIMEANALSGADVITLPAGTYTLTRANAGGVNEDADATGDLDVNGSLTINGAGAATTIIQAGTNGTNGIDKVFALNPICASPINVTIDGVTIRFGRNSQPSGAGDFSFTGGGIDWCATGSGSVFTLSNSIVSDNTNVNSYGGGLNVDSSAATGFTVNLTNDTFSNNSTLTTVNTGSGGAVNLFGSGLAVNVTNSTFSGNSTANATSGGGAIYFRPTTQSSLSVSGSSFTNNTAAGIGGGIATNTFGAGTTVTIQNSTFSGNHATNSFGGALDLDSTNLNTTPFSLSHLTITGNSAGTSGGGVYVGNSNVSLAKSLIVGNSAPTGSGLHKSVDAATATASNNWWGCSTGPGAAPCDRATTAGGTLSFTPWYRNQLTASASPLVVNQSASLSASFLTNSANSAVPVADLAQIIGRSVTWAATHGNLSSTQSTVQAAGTATGSFQATAAGTAIISAQVDNDNTAPVSSNVLSLTVNKADTTTVLSGDTPDPTVTGQSYTVSFSVTGSQGNTPTAPTGNVTVSDGTDSCVASAAAGQCTLTSSTAGSKTLTASYAGDSNFNSSASAGAAHTVNKADTTTTLISDNADPSVVGESVTVKYSVTVSAPGGGTPGGTVTVSNGTQSCTGTPAAGQCSIAFTSAGSTLLTTSYSGDTNYNASTVGSAEPHQVNQADTTTSITSDNPDPSSAGQSVTVNYTVTVNAPGAGTPTGSVTVSDGVDSCSGSVAAGTCDITLTTAGSRTLSASYPGDSNYNSSTSAGEPHSVFSPTTTTTITSDDPDPSVVGQTVTVKYSVTATGGTPTGNVSVSDGTDSCTGTVASAQCDITFTSAGSKSIIASYQSDGTFDGSTSAAEAHLVNPASTVTSITSDSPDPSDVGQSVTVDYTVTVSAPGAGTPTGSVTVSDGVDSCSGSVAAGTCDITLTTAGSRTLTAAYTGDSNFSSSTSAGEPHSVIQPLTVTIDQAAGQADPTSNHPILFTAVFSAPVTGFDASDVSLGGTAGATSVGVTGGPSTYSVAVDGMTMDGTVTASIPADAAIDASSTPNEASTSTDNMVTFVLDNTPPDTTIDSSPSNPSFSTSASFSFSGTDDQTPSGSLAFLCQLDGGGFSSCTSPKAYSGLSLGSHTFEVAAQDAAGNIDLTPASYTWTIQAATSLLYNGPQIVNIGNSFKPAARLSSGIASCASGQTIEFSLDRSPFDGSAGPYALGSAVTNSSGQATMSTAISTSGWQEGIYDLTASFAGTSDCLASSDVVTLAVASSGDSASGGGWYTLAGSGRINFGFTVSKVDNTCKTNCAYKGQLLLINNGKWRLKGSLDSYVKTATHQVAAGGTGDLFWWDSSLNGGLGDWSLAASDVAFTANFFDSGKTGKASTDSFTINIQYTPAPPQPGNLPNSNTLQVLKGGDIRVK